MMAHPFLVWRISSRRLNHKIRDYAILHLLDSIDLEHFPVPSLAPYKSPSNPPIAMDISINCLAIGKEGDAYWTVVWHLLRHE
jgi:hypothetical protein